MPESLAGVFEAAGIQGVRRYRYWDPTQRGVSVQQLLEDLGSAPEQSVVVLFASAHCPTGAHLSQESWRLVAELMVVGQTVRETHHPTITVHQTCVSHHQ